VLTFELGAVYDKQKKPVEAEAAFRQVLAADPEHAPALNYLGYMLAERGEKLDESVDLVKRALKMDPENGAYLDSLGWAYYKAGKFDLAIEPLQRAADQLQRNSVIQDHYGDVLLKLDRVEDAIAAWNRALSGDGESSVMPNGRSGGCQSSRGDERAPALALAALSSSCGARVRRCCLGLSGDGRCS
jgi:tetratricopeptide (TPR) repeat protein